MKFCSGKNSQKSAHRHLVKSMCVCEWQLNAGNGEGTGKVGIVDGKIDFSNSKTSRKSVHSYLISSMYLCERSSVCVYAHARARVCVCVCHNTRCP